MFSDIELVCFLISGKSGVVPNIPPGVPPMIGTQYMISQGGLPYYQPPVYSYEDVQLLPHRIPQMVTIFFGLSSIHCLQDTV